MSAEGLVTAVSNGTAQITARAGTASATATVTVNQPVLPEVSVCDRTPQIRDEILSVLEQTDCEAVTAEHLSSIIRMVLVDRGITSMLKGDLQGLDNLLEFRLRLNPLQHLPVGVFEEQRELTYLEISYSSLTELAPGVFKGLRNLIGLALYSNSQLTGLPAGTFSDLEGLRLLNLDYAGFTALPVGVFDGLNNVEQIWMRGTPLAGLPSGVFEGLDELKVLWFTGSRLTELPNSVFDGLTNLEQLTLGNNLLSELPPGAFLGLRSLETLDLAGNPGVPFALTLELVRTDTSDRLSPGPAEVEVRMRLGAPFAISGPLSTANGNSSADTFTIAAGDTASAVVVITPEDGPMTSTHVSLPLLPQIPAGFTGFEVRVGDPLVLFAESDNAPPVVMQKIPYHVLQVGGPTPELDLSVYFSDPDEDKLSYEVTPDDFAISTQVDGQRATLTPESEGETSVLVSATDAHGLVKQQRFVVKVLPESDPNTYDIEVVFVDTPSEDTRSATLDAVERWTEIVLSDLPDVPIVDNLSKCSARSRRPGIYPVIYADVDDLLIFVEIAPISGGKAFAGPCGKRDGSFLPFEGWVVLDTEFAASDGQYYTILHEIGHVLGIGTLWEDLDLLRGSGGTDPHFIGPLTISAFDDAGGENYAGAKVPIASYDHGHWRGDVFGWNFPRELMMEGGGTLLSAITIQSLADLGYDVDLSQADRFMLPDLATRVQARSEVSIIDGDISSGPVVIVDESGRVVRVTDD